MFYTMLNPCGVRRPANPMCCATMHDYVVAFAALALSFVDLFSFPTAIGPRATSALAAPAQMGWAARIAAASRLTCVRRAALCVMPSRWRRSGVAVTAGTPEFRARAPGPARAVRGVLVWFLCECVGGGWWTAGL